jgi:hypothetical protein
MNMDKFCRMHIHHQRKAGLGNMLDAENIINEDIDVKSHQIKNLGTPTDPTDAANKAYIDACMFTFEDRTRRVEFNYNGLEEHVRKMWAYESNLVKQTDFYELFKDEIKFEKNKLINALHELISGKIGKASILGETNPETLNKLDLQAILEKWRDT